MGDEIIITGDARDGVDDEEFTTEERRIKKIDGTQITLDRALENSHAGAGKKYRCEVAKLLDPIDDQPPATIITWPKRGLPVKLGKDGTLKVRGTSTDDYEIAGVVVNGVEASDLDYNFTGWSVKLSGLKPDKLKLTALATDKAENREQTAHILMITIIE